MQDFESLLDTYEDFYVPRFEVTVGDTTITEADGLVSGLTVKTALEKANRTSFTVTVGTVAEGDEFTEIGPDSFSEGEETRVKLGYGNEILLLFYGKLESVEPQFDAGSGSSISVAAEDPRTRMKASTADEAWEEDSIADAVQKVTDSYDFETEIERQNGGSGTSPGSLKLDKLVQASENDREFLSLLAKKYGYEMFFRDETFHFRRPNRSAEAAALQLTYGRSLRSLKPGQPGEGRDVKSVVVKHFDRKKRKLIEGTASRDEGSTEVKRTVAVESQEEAEVRAQAILDRLTRGPTTEAEIVGLPDVRVGTPVEIAGLPDEFNGAYYVEEADHSIDSSGYTTTITTRKID